jgi:hypothetical protein
LFNAAVSWTPISWIGKGALSSWRNYYWSPVSRHAIERVVGAQTFKVSFCLSGRNQSAPWDDFFS